MKYLLLAVLALDVAGCVQRPSTTDSEPTLPDWQVIKAGKNGPDLLVLIPQPGITCYASRVHTGYSVSCVRVAP